jgi:hypothetical protein
MNNNSEGHQSETRFDAPDMSDLMERSTELTNRTRVVLQDMAEISRRLNEAITRSDRLLRTSSHLLRPNEDQI